MTYTPHGPLLQSFHGSDVMPRQDILGPHRDLFLYEYAKMLLHGKLREEGILSPYAKPVHSRTEIATENTNDKIETEMLEKLGEDIQKVQQPQKSEWQEVRKGRKNQEAYQQTPPQYNHHNMYEILEANEEEQLYEGVDANEDKSNNPDESTNQQKHAFEDMKQERIVKGKEVGINTMSMEELVKLVQQCEGELEDYKKKTITIDECYVQGNHKEVHKLNQYVRSLEERLDKEGEDVITLNQYYELHTYLCASEVVMLREEHEGVGNRLKEMKNENAKLKETIYENIAKSRREEERHCALLDEKDRLVKEVDRLQYQIAGGFYVKKRLEKEVESLKLKVKASHECNKKENKNRKGSWHGKEDKHRCNRSRHK